MKLLVKRLRQMRSDLNQRSKSSPFIMWRSVVPPWRFVTTSLYLSISLALCACDEGTSSSQEEVGGLRESVAGDEPETDLAPEWDETARAWIEAASEESLVLHLSLIHI